MKIVKFIFTLGKVIILTCIANAQFDVDIFMCNFDDHNNQSVFTGEIDSPAIIGGNFEFYLTDRF